MGDGSNALISLEEGALVGVGFGGSVAAPSDACCCCAFLFGGGDDGEGMRVGVGGPDGKGVVSTVLVVPVFHSGTPSRRHFGTRIEASWRTVRWCASVVAALSVRKKRYWTMIGARTRNVVGREGCFSRRVQVR